MKKFVLSVFAIAAMASCMQDEVISQDQQAIDFGTPFVDKATKVDTPTDPTYGTGTNAVALQEFYVYGTVKGEGAGIVNIFKNVKVTGNVGSNVWSYNTQYNQYWIENANYNFAAVKNGVQTEPEESTTVASVTTDVNGMPQSIAYTTSTQYDLLYATDGPIKGKATGNGYVNFNFQHLLSKAHFTVTSNTADGYYHNVTNIKVKNFAEGTYTVANANPWNTYEATPDTDIAFADINNVNAAAGNETNATQVLLIPTKSAFTVSFTVEIWNGSTKLGSKDYTKTVEIKEGGELVGLQAGHAYNFTLALTVGELIQFTVTQAPQWAPTTNVPVTLQ